MGAFIRHFLADEVLVAVDRLRAVADQAGMTVAQLALAWVLREPNVAAAIIGASRPSQLEENCAAAGRRLDADVLAAAEKAVAEVVER
jgi:aryl-alcohol dehydrogenase-like predicted oxidoreductase